MPMMNELFPAYSLFFLILKTTSHNMLASYLRRRQLNVSVEVKNSLAEIFAPCLTL